MADNTYTNISDLPTLDSVGENTWVPVEIAGKQGKKVDLSTIGGSVEQKQADWNQTDDTQADFIKNKPVVIELSTNESTLDITDSVLSFDTSEASDGSVLTYVGNGEVSWQPCEPELDLNSIDSSGGTDFSSIQIAGYKNAPVNTVPIKTSNSIDWVELPDVPAVDGLTIVNNGGTLNVDTDGFAGDGIISIDNKLNINVGNGLTINDDDNDKLQIDIEGSGGCLHFTGRDHDKLAVRYDGRSINSQSTSDDPDNYMLEINGFNSADEDTIPVKITDGSTPIIKWLPFVKSSDIRAKTASIYDRFKFHLEVVIDDTDNGDHPIEWHFEWVEDT